MSYLCIYQQSDNSDLLWTGNLTILIFSGKGYELNYSVCVWRGVRGAGASAQVRDKALGWKGIKNDTTPW